MKGREGRRVTGWEMEGQEERSEIGRKAERDRRSKIDYRPIDRSLIVYKLFFYLVFEGSKIYGTFLLKS